MIQFFNNINFMRLTGIFAFTDLIEITLFILATSWLLNWLSKNNYRYLIGYFHGFCILFFTSYFFNLTAIHYFLSFFSPLFFTLFVIFHQKSLQKNFIGKPFKKTYIPAQTQWLAPIMQSCLHSINQNKSIHCIIERKDPLLNLLQTSFTFNAEIDKNILSLIFQSPEFNSQQLVWITEEGIFKSINTIWNIPNQEEWFSPTTQNESQWIEQAQVFTAQTDAIIFSITPEKRLFNIIIDGKHIADIPAYNFIKFMKMYGIKEKVIKEKRNLSHEHKKTYKESVSDQSSY